MKKNNASLDVRDEKLGKALRKTLDREGGAEERAVDFTAVYARLENENSRLHRDIHRAAFTFLPAAAAAALILVFSPFKAGPSPDFKSAVAILSSESVRDDTWSALSGIIESAGTPNGSEKAISGFIDDLWNQDDILFD